jgi:hypothetical protein
MGKMDRIEAGYKGNRAPLKKPLFRVIITNADGALVRGVPSDYESDTDPFKRETRVMLMDESLFKKGAGRKDFLTTLEASAAVNISRRRPIPHHLPATAKYALVTAESGYSARYMFAPLPVRELIGSIPEGGLQTGPKELIGRFSEYAGQRYTFLLAHSPWDAAAWVYVKCVEETPFPDDSEESLAFIATLIRSVVPGNIGVHAIGRRHTIARAFLCSPRVYPPKEAITGSNKAKSINKNKRRQ